KLLSKKLDETVETWEAEKEIDRSYYDELSKGHFRKSKQGGALPIFLFQFKLFNPGPDRAFVSFEGGSQLFYRLALTKQRFQLLIIFQRPGPVSLRMFFPDIVQTVAFV